MAYQLQSRPEPMNATPHHSKVRLSVTLSDKFYIAGDAITGKMELESRADTGLGLGIIAVELVAIEELTSRDHSATSTFIHTRRLFQGPGLPPSNAVLAHPVAGEPPLPAHYHQARRGLTTFLFRIPLPPSSPPSIDFGNGLARIRYEVSACAGVAWKNQNRLVTSQCPVDVLQRYPGDDDPVLGDDSLHNWPAPECLVIGEGGKVWAQARVLGGMLIAGESACIELQVKNHSAKKTSGIHITLGRHLHLPSPAHGSGKKAPPPLQISDTLASIAFRGPEYTSNPGTEGIAQLVFDVPRTARTVSAHPRHAGDVEENEDEAIAVKKRTPPLFEIRGVVTIRISMPLGSTDIVLELPVAIFHPATLPPPPPEPYPYPAPDAYMDPVSVSPTPLLHTPMPMLYPEPTQSPLYAYHAIPLPLSPAPMPLNGQLVIPPYTPHNGQLWFPPLPPAYIGGGGDPIYYQPPPLRPASANIMAPTIPSGLPVSGTPDHVLSSFSQLQLQQQQPEQTIGHGALAARISHHLRLTSRARSVSPPPAPTQQLEVVELISPKPIPSPKLTTLSVEDPFAQSFGTRTRTRSLSVVKLEEMAARAAAESEAKADLRAAAVEKTLPAPPVPSGKLPLARLGAQDIFGDVGGDIDVPRTPSLSALSLLRPPQRHDQQPILPKHEDSSGLDALERRLVEQVGTRRHAPPPPPPPTQADPPPAPIPAPVPVPGNGKASASAEMNESAISSLALGAEESFGGRNGNVINLSMLGGETDDVECEVEVEDLDARTQRLSKGGATGGASSGSERGTHKARSRKSAKSDREKDRDSREKKARKKREGRDEEAARIKRAAKGRVAEWLEKLASPESEQDARSPTLPEPESESEAKPAPEPVPEPAPEPTRADPVERPPTVLESKPNPRSSGFISVTTLRRAPISLPAPSSPESAQPTPPAPAPAPAPAARNLRLPPIRRVANRYPPPPLPQMEMKYDVKSARGGRGGRVMAVASIWAEASKAGEARPTQTQTPKPKPKVQPPKASAGGGTPAPKPIKPMTSIVAPGTPKIPTHDDDKRVFVSRGRPPLPRAATSPAKSDKEKDDPSPPQPRVQRALFGLGVAAAATPSSPALSSSIATPVLSSTASLAQPPGARTRARAVTPEMPPDAASRRTPSPQPQTPSQQAAPAPGWRAPLVSGAGLKADLAFGQARLRDLIRRYQGQAA